MGREGWGRKLLWILLNILNIGFILLFDPYRHALFFKLFFYLISSTQYMG